MGRWRRHSREFKRQAVKRMKACDNIRALARELDIQQKLLYVWKYELEGKPKAAVEIDPEVRKQQKLKEEVSRLKQALADKTLEADFFRSALQRLKERRQGNAASGAPASTNRSGK